MGERIEREGEWRGRVWYRGKRGREMMRKRKRGREEAREKGRERKSERV